jgi:hypothetical protein
MLNSYANAGSLLIMRYLRNYAERLHRSSRMVTRFFENRMATICGVWLAVTFTLALTRLALPAGGPIGDLASAVPILVAYSMILAAPILGFVIGRDAFKGEAAIEQPRFRFALFGRWRKLSVNEARENSLFGPVGFMASLLVGMMLNVVFRTLEFFASVPAVGMHAPAWAQMMFAIMAIDLVLTSFFYMVAFAMALRAVPLFPRMLLFAWAIDMAMQLVIAQQLSAVGGVPGAVVAPLVTLLEGNMTKVAISAVIWLPYLLLSERVNLTYRHRTDARLAQ